MTARNEVARRELLSLLETGPKTRTELAQRLGYHTEQALAPLLTGLRAEGLVTSILIGRKGAPMRLRKWKLACKTTSAPRQSQTSSEPATKT